MPPIPTLLIILAILGLFSALFSASETALIALNKVRLRHMVEQKKKGAPRVYKLISRMDKLIATILIGNSLVNTGIASISTVIFTHFLGGEGWTLVIATFATTIALVVVCELTPKVVATGHPEGVAFLLRHFVDLCIKIFGPLTQLLTWVSNGVIRLFGGNPHHRSPLLTEEELKMMITIGKEEGFYGDTERRMLERIFHFDEIEVRDVMTKLDDVTAVPLDIQEEELERVMTEEGHNRIPVYKDTKQNIIGILYVRDLIYLIKNSTLIQISDLMSAAYFVPPHKRVNELLKEFQKRKLQIAIVRDVDGRAIGLVTLEDLIEEIVGEIDEIDSNLLP
jgi:putative hemolysin